MNVESPMTAREPGDGTPLQVLLLSTRDVGAHATGRVSVLRTHLGALEALGHHVHVAVVSPQPPGDSSWTRRFPTTHVRAPALWSVAASAARALLTRRSTLNECLFVDRSVQRHVADLVAELRPDVVVVDSLRLSRATGAAPVRLVVDLDDLLSVRYRELRAEASTDPVGVLGFAASHVPGPLRGGVARLATRLLGWESRRAGEREEAVTASASAVSLVAAHEVDVLRRRTGREVHWLPPAVHLPERPATPHDGLVFLGGLDYLPNLQGLRFYRDSVLGHLDPQDPRHVLHVVGRCPEEHRAEFDVPGIEVHGYVDDLSEALGRRLLVAPLLSGGGIKLKVLDGMAHGLPVVGTTGAFAGLGAPGDLVQAADDGQQLAGLITTLLDDPERCARLGAAGRDLIAQHFVQASAQRRWATLLTTVMAPVPGGRAA